MIVDAFLLIVIFVLFSIGFWLLWNATAVAGKQYLDAWREKR